MVLGSIEHGKIYYGNKYCCMKTPKFTKMVIASSRAYSWPSTGDTDAACRQIIAMLWTCVLIAAYLSNGGEFASI